ncbi:uncharacterized protein LOC143024615 [Oratosquilla oratoria]|uniref:uncharacterized protein LOC143024615 n=1 Tax=Oratosquilla oratoria TaxID=337810 RepID=UPI003F7671A7
MDFDERRMFSMNMGHPMAHQAVGHATTQPVTHARLMMQDGQHTMVTCSRPMDVSMASITNHVAGASQLALQQAVQQQQIIHQQQQTQHPAQHQAQIQRAQQQPLELAVVTAAGVAVTEAAPQAGPSMVQVFVGTSQQSEVPHEERHEDVLADPLQDPLQMEQQQHIEMQDTHHEEQKQQGHVRWCLVCDKGLPGEETEDTVNLYKATMSVSQRKLSAMLGRLVGLTLYRAHSDVLCSRCYNLVEQVDGLEIELADTKMELVSQYEKTIEHRQPHAKREIERPSLEVDVEWEESNESEVPENDDDDPDCTAKGTKRKKKRKTKRKGKPRKVTKLTAKVKTQGLMDNSGDDLEMDGKPRKRGRGRPRKKDKEEEDYISPGAPTKECPSCKKTIHSKRFLVHLANHRLFPCPFCEAVFKRKDIKTHLAEAHQEEIHYPCTECDDVFDTFMQLRSHCLVVHMGIERERAQCSMCNKTFSSANGLKVHMETIHTKSQEYECPECKETFNQKGNMQNHYRRVHQGDDARKLQCDICSKGFICPSDLRKHVERVHLKVRKNEVMCEVCGKPFSDTRAMKIHINAIHTKEVQYPCPDCKMVFHSLTNMVTHRRRMHGGTEGRKNVCEVCGKGFCSPSDLRTHMKVVHENIRKYICDMCGQSFKVGSHLKYHRRRHTGETPYECPHCDKCFHGPSHIADHVKKVHKTVYMGVNQRRRLNLPENAPPPPPGILTPREPKPKNPVLNPHPAPAAPPPPHVTQANSSASISSMQHLHPNMMSFTQPNPMIGPTSMMDHHNMPHNPYANLQFDQNNTQSPVPMVVRFLHEMQY